MFSKARNRKATLSWCILDNWNDFNVLLQFGQYEYAMCTRHIYTDQAHVCCLERDDEGELCFSRVLKTGASGFAIELEVYKCLVTGSSPQLARGQTPLTTDSTCHQNIVFQLQPYSTWLAWWSWCDMLARSYQYGVEETCPPLSNLHLWCNIMWLLKAGWSCNLATHSFIFTCFVSCKHMWVCRIYTFRNIA